MKKRKLVPNPGYQPKRMPMRWWRICYYTGANYRRPYHQKIRAQSPTLAQEYLKASLAGVTVTVFRCNPVSE